MENKDYRGVGYSKDKVCKGTGLPKRAGNFSYCTVHQQGVQAQDYKVRLENGVLIVGDHTPLAKLMTNAVAELALNDPYFNEYHQQGVKTVANKQYEAHKYLRKINYNSNAFYNYLFIYREMIYTDMDFDYNFPEY